MDQLKQRLYQGMASNGITGELADDLYLKLSAFANYGFPESHAMSFALLVFASAWFKRYHPAAFCAALVNAQPMGFYSTQSLVDDARRHGVEVRRPDINASGAHCTLEPPAHPGGPRNRAGDRPSQWGVGGPAVRLGLSEVRTIGDDLAERIQAEREVGGPFRDMRDLARRMASEGKPLTTANLEALATADAFACFDAVNQPAVDAVDQPALVGATAAQARRPLSRREALWAAGAAAQERADRLPGTTMGVHAPTLPGMDEVESMVADVWSTGLSPDTHPVRFVRAYLATLGALSVDELATGQRNQGAGRRDRHPSPTARNGRRDHLSQPGGRDRHGQRGVLAWVWQRHRKVARTASAMVIGDDSSGSTAW
jgi:error-prone DNA polymerase